MIVRIVRTYGSCNNNHHEHLNPQLWQQKQRQKQIPIVLIQLLVLLYVSQNWTIVCYAKPFILLTNKIPKCFQIQVPTDYQQVTIEYECPDLVIVNDDPNSAITNDVLNQQNNQDQQQQQQQQQLLNQRQLEYQKERNFPNVQDGLDARFNVDLRNRMDMLKKAHLKDINIAITPRNEDGHNILLQQNIEIKDDGTPIQRKVRHQVESIKGTIPYIILSKDHTLEICIQSYSATQSSPSRIMIDVIGSLTDNQMNEQRIILEQKQQLKNQRTKNINEQTDRLLNMETNRISSELIRMKRRSEGIVHEIEFSSVREKEFYQLSISLNNAVQYYPLIRILIILMAAFIQVHTIIEYMKSKHIY